jgi:hypothetical protein
MALVLYVWISRVEVTGGTMVTTAVARFEIGVEIPITQIGRMRVEGSSVVDVEDNAPRDVHFEPVALALASGRGGERFAGERVGMDTWVFLAICFRSSKGGNFDKGLFVLSEDRVWWVDEAVDIVIVVI